LEGRGERIVGDVAASLGIAKNLLPEEVWDDEEARVAVCAFETRSEAYDDAIGDYIENY
jgi:hypothetical protein